MIRIAVWMLEQARHSGVSGADLLSDDPDFKGNLQPSFLRKQY
jgi:hypothetical protein